MNINLSLRFAVSMALLLTAYTAVATDKADALMKQPPKEQALAFVENRNQWPSPVKYKADLPGGRVFLTGSGFTYSYYSQQDLDRLHELAHDQPGRSRDNELVNCHAYRVTFVGANANPRMETGDKKKYYHNYFLGNDPSKWAGNVSVFGKVVYQDIYSGVDAAVYSNGTSMKYDFIVAPGASTTNIALNFEGVTPQILPNGNMRIRTSVNELEEGAPYAYQVINGVQKEVKCHYVLDAKTNNVRFEFPQGYDKAVELVIDPTLVFGTYSGGTGSTYGFSATYDVDGNLYAGGECFGPGWPTTAGAYQLAFSAGQDAGINKYNALGTDLVYSTYYGGTGSDLPNNMVVNASNELVVCGSTSSANLPVTPGCYDNSLGGSSDIYVVHFNATGSALIGATYLGGSGVEAMNNGTLSNNYGDANRGEVFTDAAGNIYIASSTSSTDFPVTATAAQSASGGSQDGCIAKFNPNCSSLLYSTYLGGTGIDACFALVLNSAGNVVTIGGTTSTDFPTVAGGLHTTSQGGAADGFATVISLTTGLVNSTYLGTSAYDHAFKVQIDATDNIYVMGQTLGNYPISAGVYNLAGNDIFIDKLSPTLSSSLLSTRLGNTQTGIKFVPTAFLLDECGNTYLCGFNPNTTLPVSPNAFATSGGFWLAVLEPDFDDLLYATFIGGGGHVDGGTSRFDPKGIVYHSVCTNQLDFPTSPTVWSPNKLASGYDCASFKFNFEATGVHAEFVLAANSSDSGCVPHTVSFLNESIVADNYVWDFGDGSPTTTDPSPTHTFNTPGVFTVTLRANNPVSCVTDDSFKMKIWVFSADEPQLVTNDTVICLFQNVDIGVNILNPSTTVGYSWTPTAAINGNPNQQIVNVNPAISQDFTVTVTNTDALCSASATANVHIDVFDPILFNMVSNDTVICKGQSVPLTVEGLPIFTYQWSPDIDLVNADTNSTIATPQVSRKYQVTVTYGDCLPHYDSVWVNVEPVPEVNAGPDRIICSYDTVQLYAGALPSSFGSYKYEWHPGIHLTDSTIVNPVFHGEETTILEVKVSTPAGCFDKDSVSITVHPGDFLVVTPDTGACPPAEIQLQAGGAESYHWSPAYGLDNTNIANPKATPGTSVTYMAVGVNKYNCVDSQAVTVDVYPQAVINLADQATIWPGEHYNISPESNCLYFSWFPTSGLNSGTVSNPEASPAVRTRYYVTATTEHGCVVKDSIDILMNEESVLDMPNAFTPNDAYNGELKVMKRGIATLKYFRVYNRWGNKVFETSDINQGWNGAYKNSPQPMGVYIYSIEAVTNTGKLFTKQGNVTLIR